jgi:hypothetical protein
VSGTMDDSVTVRMSDTRSPGECVVAIFGRLVLLVGVGRKAARVVFDARCSVLLRRTLPALG